MSIKNIKINKKVFEVIDNGYTFVKENAREFSVGFGILTLVAIMGGTLITVKAVDINNEKQFVIDQPIIQEYNQKMLAGVTDTKFIEEFNKLEYEIENLYKYINISEELHDLHLNSSSYGEVISTNNSNINLPSPEEIQKEIVEFKELKKAKADNLNSKACELREIEKLVNKKVLSGYHNLVNYGQMQADLMIANANGLQPSDVNVFVYEAGEVSAVVNGHYDAKETRKIEGYLNVINRVYQYSNGNSGSRDNGYNHDRNEVLSDSIEALASVGIERIEKDGNILEVSKRVSK